MCQCPSRFHSDIFLIVMKRDVTHMMSYTQNWTALGCLFMVCGDGAVVMEMTELKETSASKFL